MNEDTNYDELFGLSEAEPDGGGQEGAGDGGADEASAGQAEPPETGGEARGEEPGGAEPQGLPGPVGATGPRGDMYAGGQEPLMGASGRGMPAGMREDEYLDSVIRSLGIADPYSGGIIETKRQYDEYQRRSYEERRGQVISRSGLTQAEFDDLVNSSPEVVRARENSRMYERLIQQQREAQAREKVNSEVAKISAMDPAVKTLADLTGKEYSRELTELVKRGYDLSHAYIIANQSAIRRGAAEASRQAAHNSGAGRAGFVQTRQNGQGNDLVPVPSDVLEMYKALNPEMSDAEIRADYNKYLKK